VLSHAPAAKVRTRPEAMATDFRFIFFLSGLQRQAFQAGSIGLAVPDADRHAGLNVA
jgi:hypothetical protein